MTVNLADPAGPPGWSLRQVTAFDILVNNVGGAPARPGGFLSITDEDWLATINLDLMSAVRATRSALSAMLGGGSGLGHHHLLGQRTAARPGRPRLQHREGGPRRLLPGAVEGGRDRRASAVNTVSPGPVATGSVAGEPAASRRRSAMPPERIRGTWPARRPARWVNRPFQSGPARSADAVLFLASRHAGATSPVPTSPSTAAWSLPGQPADRRVAGPRRAARARS